MLSTVLASLLAVFGACSVADKSLSATQAEGVDFQSFRTYRWMPDGGDSVNNMSIFDNQILRNRMRRAIDKELGARGLQVSEANPELAFQLVVRNKGQIKTETNTNAQYPNSYGRYPYSSNTSTTPSFFEHHQVLVNCYDAKNALIWTGALVKDYKTAPELQKNIESDMAKIMGQFPVKTRASGKNAQP